MKKVEIFLKNLLLKLLLALSNRGKTTGSHVFNEQSKILFVRLNRIGDALVTTPLLKQLKDQLGCSITVLADKSNHFIFANNPSVDNTIIFHKGLKGILKTLDIIKEGKFDAVVDLHDDVSTTVTYLLALSQVPNKFGLKKSNDVVYSATIEKPDSSKTHVVDRILEISKLFGLVPCREKANIIYCPEDKAKKKIENLILNKFPEKKTLVGVNISAGSAARFWGVENFQKIISFISSYNVNYIIICSPRDVDLAKQIAMDDTSKIFYSPSFDEFASIVSMVDLLFTPDTSIIHLASAYNVPVFGLYVKYNTQDMIWSPYKSDFDCIITEDNNLDNISIEQSIKNFKPFLEKYI